jgi:hypothetical protein
VLKDVERLIMQQKFTQYGALKLDKDIRVYQSVFVKHASASSAPLIKEKFSKVQTMCLVLNVERIDEVNDIWGDEIMKAHKFSSADIKKILSLRTEFNESEIKAFEVQV